MKSSSKLAELRIALRNPAIAAMFGVGEDAIVAANGLRDRDQLYAGQELVIPASGT